LLSYAPPEPFRDAPLALDVVLAVSGVGLWAAVDGTQQGFAMALLTAIAGPAAEIALINVLGLYQYTLPDVFGVPTWIPWVYFCGSPAVGLLARRVRATSRRTKVQADAAVAAAAAQALPPATRTSPFASAASAAEKARAKARAVEALAAEAQAAQEPPVEEETPLPVIVPDLMPQTLLEAESSADVAQPSVERTAEAADDNDDDDASEEQPAPAPPSRRRSAVLAMSSAMERGAANMEWARKILRSDPERREVLMDEMRARLERTLDGLAARRERLRRAAAAGAAAAAEGWAEEGEGWVRARSAKLSRLRELMRSGAADAARPQPQSSSRAAQAARLRDLQTQLDDVAAMLRAAVDARARGPRRSDAATLRARAIGVKLLRQELDSVRREMQRAQRDAEQQQRRG
jgi:hypothetical protein